MRIDITKNPRENILALVIASNPGLSLTLGQVSVGAPADLAGDPEYNSQVLLTAVPNAGFAGDRLITYNRLPLTSGVAVVPDSVQILADDDEAAAGVKVAAALGLVEGQYVAADFTAPENEDVPGTITLTPVADSLLYIGDAVVMALTVADADIPLADAIVADRMAGFEAVTA